MKVRIAISVEREITKDELKRMYDEEIPSDQEEIRLDLQEQIETDVLNPEEVLRNDDGCLRGSFEVSVTRIDEPKTHINVEKSHYASLLVDREKYLRLWRAKIDERWAPFEDALNPPGEPSIEEFAEAESERISKL